MLRRAQRCLVRRKHGQKAWSPNTTSSGGAPTNGVTAQEALQIAYRPMPPAQTVEYEEDFGPSMIIHREFISAKNRSRMSTDMAQLAYSDVELTKARQQLANVLNRERRGVLVGAGGQEGDRVFFNSDVDDTTREVRSARFLFNEPRMQFCDRFQNFFRQRIEQQKAALGRSGGDDGAGPGEDNHFYFSLMEACAVLHGCETDAARETYYRRFLGLDLDALEAESEALRARVADAAELNAKLRPTAEGSDAALVAAVGKDASANASPSAAPARSEDVVQGIIDAMPPLFPSSLPSTTTAEATGSASATAAAPSPPVPLSRATATTTTATTTAAATADYADDDVAPLFRAYVAHARGDSPVGSYDLTTIGARAAHAERRRWRSLMEKIAKEDYHNLTAAELEDAYVLNQQLHTVKFFDLKVGDTVREIIQLLERGSGGSSSVDRDTPAETSASHPERRV